MIAVSPLVRDLLSVVIVRVTLQDVSPSAMAMAVAIDNARYLMAFIRRCFCVLVSGFMLLWFCAIRAGYSSLWGYVRLVLLVLPAARFVPRQQGASAVLLAVDQFLFADVEDKGIECFELGLLDECRLVACHESRIFQSFASHLCDLRELSAPCSFFLGNRCSTLATYRSVFAFGKLAVVVGSAVLFGDFAREVMDWVFVNNLCHMCSAIEHRV